MKKLRINCANKYFEFGIESKKYILDLSYENSFIINQTFESYFSKAKRSEYQEENNHHYLVELDSNKLDLKTWEYTKITHDFSLINDLKLGSKSLTLRYIESSLLNLEFDDTFITMNNIRGLLNNSYINELTNIELENGLKFTPLIEDFNLKNIIKLFKVNALIDELYIEGNELDYNTIIELQLTMIDKISLYSEKRQIILIHIPKMTTYINKIITNLSSKALFLIITNNEITYFKNDELYIISNNTYDLADEEDIFHRIMMNHNRNLSLEQVIQELTEQVRTNIKAISI